MTEGRKWPALSKLRYNIAHRMRLNTLPSHYIIMEEEEEEEETQTATQATKTPAYPECSLPAVSRCENVSGTASGNASGNAPANASGKAPGNASAPGTASGNDRTPPAPPPSPTALPICQDSEVYEGMGSGIYYMHSSPKAAFGANKVSPNRKRLFPMKLTTDREEAFLQKQQMEIH